MVNFNQASIKKIMLQAHRYLFLLYVISFINWCQNFMTSANGMVIILFFCYLLPFVWLKVMICKLLSCFNSPKKKWCYCFFTIAKEIFTNISAAWEGRWFCKSLSLSSLLPSYLYRSFLISNGQKTGKKKLRNLATALFAHEGYLSAL